MSLMAKVYYYSNSKGEKPVKIFVESLSERPRAKIFRIFQIIEEYGINSIPRHVKKLEGLPLWEIRILGGQNIRVIYVIISGGNALALHGFIKKSQKTPQRETEIALNRYHDWIEKNMA